MNFTGKLMKNKKLEPPDFTENDEASASPPMGCYDSEVLHNVRRTLERGLKVAQSPPAQGNYIDLFQHALDELQASGLKFPES